MDVHKVFIPSHFIIICSLLYYKCLFQRLRSEIEDPAKLEEALEELHAFYGKKTVLDLTNLQHSVANDLKEKSQLSEEEVRKLAFLPPPFSDFLKEGVFIHIAKVKDCEKLDLIIKQ